MLPAGRARASVRAPGWPGWAHGGDRDAHRGEGRAAVGAGADGGEERAGQPRVGDRPDGDAGDVADEREVRQERDRVARRDEREEHRELVRLMADVRLEAAVLVADAPDERGHPAARVAGRPRLAGEGAERDRIAPRRQRMGARQGDAERLGEEVLALEARPARVRRARPLVGEDEVERVGAQRLEGGLGLGLDEPHPDAGMALAQRVHRGQEEPQARRLERADADHALDRARGGGGEVGLGALGAREQALGVRGEHDRRVGEPHAPAGGLEQRGAGLALEDAQLLGDGRRAVGQRVGDGADRAEPVELVKEAEAAEVEHDRSTSSHGRTTRTSVVLDRLAADHAGMRGAGLCLLSAAAFGTLGIFGRLASDAGADTATTLLVRFGLAALVFAAVLGWTGGWRALRGLSRRVVLTGLALGAPATACSPACTSPRSGASTCRSSRCCSTPTRRS